jgi:hypothetical protein
MTDVKTQSASAPLTKLIDAVDRSTEGVERVALRDMLCGLGHGGTLPLILIVAALLVSPLSGIPGLTTVAAILIVLLSAQAIWGGRGLWLPNFVLRWRMKASLVQRATAWLRRPAAWIDKRTHRRLLILSQGPARVVVLALCILIALTWPLLEFVPTSSSLLAVVIVLLTFGLLTRDGVYVLAGVVSLALVGTTAAFLFDAAVT